ncbi:MAG: hypothetical protein JST22_10750 [Bacteroidetes bacterium]|nr:hypothetical protein [Bacteroidota bacterium]
MNIVLRILPCVLLLATGIAHAQHGGATARHPAPAAIGFPEAYNGLMQIEPDSANVAPVSGITIQRDVATFHLERGTLYFCRPIGGRVCGALFIGNGSFSFTPPTEVERAHLNRMLGHDAVMQPFNRLFLLFADSTADELKRGAHFAPGSVAESDAAEIGYSLRYLADREIRRFDDEFLEALLNDDHNGLFYSQFTPDGGDPFFFEINPYVGSFENEEVLFMHRGVNQHNTPFRELVSSFPRRESGSRRVEDARPLLNVERYTIDCSIATNLDLAARCNVAFKAPARESRWVLFALEPELKVDSASWGNGERIECYQTGDGGVWMRTSTAGLASGSFTLHYHGRFFDRAEDWIVMHSSIGWYPQCDDKNRALFDLTFHIPSSMKLASIGALKGTEEHDGVTTSHWATAGPVRIASFGLGVFEEKKVETDSTAPITVYRGIHSSRGATEQIGWDVEHSIKFFEYLFGKLDAPNFSATEIPEAHGEAFPGLIHLSVSTFDRNNESGFHEIFRAHEVAHQWWGIGLDFSTYHDQWLSEGFAEYSGLMYMQAVLKDNDKFFKRLDEYRRQILGNRKSIFGNGQQAGPIWLGYRTSSSSTEGDYDLIIYRKGAWVLHMLRMMLLDLQTMKEDKYLGAMRDFFAAYRGRYASTEDFRKTMEKYSGASMDWFFKQWVYGTDVPTYKWAYKVDDAPDGKFRLQLRVDQTNVPDDFQMYVPLKIDFGDGRLARLRVLVKGPHAQPQLPLMPLKPKQIFFNDLNAVLCESEQVEWE